MFAAGSSPIVSRAFEEDHRAWLSAAGTTVAAAGKPNEKGPGEVQIAGLDMYFNHPVMALGASEWIPMSLELHGEPAAACDTHALVRVQAQITLVKVRIFLDDAEPRRGEADDGFTTVFDGQLLLADGRFVVGDLMAQSRFTTALLGLPGRRRVNVAMDDPHGLAR